MKDSTSRKLLEQRYGKGCFMERAGIRKFTPTEEKKLKKIKGYKKLDRTISYHHIKEKSKGEEVSADNGANLAIYNHQWFHQQPPEIIEDINNKLQDFKVSIDLARLEIGEEGLNIEKVLSINFDMEDTISIPLYDNTPEIEEKRHKKFNRAEVKRETSKLIEEELYR